jgi:hypothetical protein
MRPVLHGNRPIRHPAYILDLTADRYFGEAQPKAICQKRQAGFAGAVLSAPQAIAEEQDFPGVDRGEHKAIG